MKLKNISEFVKELENKGLGGIIVFGESDTRILGTHVQKLLALERAKLEETWLRIRTERLANIWIDNEFGEESKLKKIKEDSFSYVG